MEHYLIRSTITPVIIKYIQDKYNMSEEEALRAFYVSATADAFADDTTGLYGQSPLYIFGLFMDEYDEMKALKEGAS